MLLAAVDNPQHKVDDHGQQQNDGQDRGSKAIIEARLAPHPYALGPPMIREQGVYHGQHGNTREEEGRDEGRAVSEVEHADGQGAEDHGEVEP